MGKGNLQSTNIQKRLDRSMANKQWMSLFPNTTIRHLHHSLSNYCPLLLQLQNVEVRRGRMDFKFEA